MKELKPDVSSARAFRAVALIVLALVALGASAGIYLWRSGARLGNSTARTPGSAPALVDMTSVSEQEAWVIVHQSAGSRSVLLHTADGGASWQPQFSIDGTGAVRFADPRRGVLVSWRRGGSAPIGTPQVFSTNDAGASWRSVTMPEIAPDFAGVPFFLEPDHGWVLATRSRVPGEQSAQDVRLWRTADGGRHWESLLSIDGMHPFSHGISGGPQLASVSFQDRDSGWIVTQGAAASAVVYITHDGGREWRGTPLPAGLPGPAFDDWLYLRDAVMSPGGRGVLPVVDREANRIWVYQTLDGGESWSNPGDVPGTAIMSVAFVNGSVGWATGNGTAWVTTDSGRSWLAGVGLPGALQFGGVAPVSASVAWVQGLEVNGASNAPPRWAMFRTHDAGLHWTRVKLPSVS